MQRPRKREAEGTGSSVNKKSRKATRATTDRSVTGNLSSGQGTEFREDADSNVQENYGAQDFLATSNDDCTGSGSGDANTITITTTIASRQPSYSSSSTPRSPEDEGRAPLLSSSHPAPDNQRDSRRTAESTPAISTIQATDDTDSYGKLVRGIPNASPEYMRARDTLGTGLTDPDGHDPHAHLLAPSPALAKSLVKTIAEVRHSHLHTDAGGGCVCGEGDFAPSKQTLINAFENEL